MQPRLHLGMHLTWKRAFVLLSPPKASGHSKLVLHRRHWQTSTKVADLFAVSPCLLPSLAGRYFSRTSFPRLEHVFPSKPMYLFLKRRKIIKHFSNLEYARHIVCLPHAKMYQMQAKRVPTSERIHVSVHFDTIVGTFRILSMWDMLYSIVDAGCSELRM